MEVGRQERFRALYLHARPKILAYALRRTRTTEDAADAVADTFATAWRRLDDVPEGDEGVIWLYATARNVLSNQARRERRHSRLIERIGETLAGEKVLVAPPDEGVVLALVALRSLAPDEREVLMLAAWEGLDDAGAGRVLGCSPGAARIRLHRARKRLEELIAALSGQDTDQNTDQKHPGVAGHKENEGAAFGRAQEEA